MSNVKKKKVQKQKGSKDEKAQVFSSSTDEDSSFHGWDTPDSNTLTISQREIPGTSQNPKASKGRSSTKVGTCGKCDGIISKADKALTCSGCSRVFHLTCSNFNKHVYKVIQTYDCFNDVLWRCQDCKSKPPLSQAPANNAPSNQTLMNLISNLQARVAKLETVTKKSEPVRAKPLGPQVNVPIANKVTHQVIVPPVDNAELEPDSKFIGY